LEFLRGVGIAFSDIEALVFAVSGDVRQEEGSCRARNERDTKVPLSSPSGEGSKEVSGLRVAGVVQTTGGATMRNVMIYKGYTARVEFDERDDILWEKSQGSRIALLFTGRYRLEPDIGNPGFLALDGSHGILDDRVAARIRHAHELIEDSRCLIAVLFQICIDHGPVRVQNAASSFRLVVLGQWTYFPSGVSPSCGEDR
jgi:hypothetical protein